MALFLLHALYILRNSEEQSIIVLFIKSLSFSFKHSNTLVCQGNLFKAHFSLACSLLGSAPQNRHMDQWNSIENQK